MVLPWRFNKRMIMSDNNDVKESNHSSLNPVGDYKAKAKRYGLNKSNCVKPAGIIFNYNIQKSKTVPLNDSNSVITGNQSDNTAKIETETSLDHQNDDVPGVEDSTMIPNKLYKIVLIDGKTMLTELSPDDTVEAKKCSNERNTADYVNNNNNDDSNIVNPVNDNRNSKDNVLHVNDNNDISDITEDASGNCFRKCKAKIANTDENNSSISLVSCNDSEIKPVYTKPIITYSKKLNYSTAPPKILNEDPQPMPLKLYRYSNVPNENVVKEIGNIDNLSSPQENMYSTKKNMADARRGKAMVLVPLEKYTLLKRTVTDIENRENETAKKNIKMQEEELEERKKNAMKETEMKEEERKTRLKNFSTQTDKCHKEELAELSLLRTRLARLFTEAQISVIKGVKSYDIKWSDSEMERLVFLKQIISKTAYEFLKFKMHFPLPPLSTLRQWMIDKNIFVKPKRTMKTVKAKKGTNTAAGEDLESKQNVPSPLNENIHSENENHSIEITCAQAVCSETMQAVNTIVNEQAPHLNTGNSIEVHHTLSLPTVTGEQIVYYYTHEDNIRNGNDGNEDNYMGDGTIGSFEEVEQTKVIRRRRTVTAEARPRCRLCLRPFDTEQEIREHVPVHYNNMYYTTYLDATSPFVCEFCNERVKFRFDLVNHHRAHLGIEHLRCWYPGCDYIGKNMDNLKSHHDRHNPASFKCDVCGALFKTDKYMRQHRERRHSAPLGVRCALCRAVCKTEFTYRKHLQSHTRPPRIKCKQAECEELFYSRLLMRKHLLSCHGGPLRPHKCALCPAAYMRETQLASHLNKHETHKISHCVKCLKVFYDYGEFYKHCLEHKDSKYKCACGERFNNQEQLDEHKLQCTVPGDKRKTKKVKKRKENEEETTTTMHVDEHSDQKPKRRKTALTLPENNLPVEEEVVLPEETYDVTEIQENICKTVPEMCTQNVVETADNQQQEAITILEVNEDKVIALEINNKQGVIRLAPNYLQNSDQQHISAVQEDAERNVAPIVDNQIQKYIVIPKHHQLRVVKVLGKPQHAVTENHEQKVIKAEDNNQRKVITQLGNRKRKLVIAPVNYQQYLMNISETEHSQNTTSVPENKIQKVVVLKNNDQPNVIVQENTHNQDFLTLPTIQQNNEHIPSEQHKLKARISVPKGHLKKLKAIAMANPLGKAVAMSTITNKISGLEGNYGEKVIPLPVNNPIKKEMTVLENPLKKVISVPEMQIQNEIIALSAENKAFILNTRPKDTPIKQVVVQTEDASTLEMKPKQLIVKLAGSNQVTRLTEISREEMIAALANNRQKKVHVISETANINNNITHTPQSMMQGNNNQGQVDVGTDQVVESGQKPDMPIIDIEL